MNSTTTPTRNPERLVENPQEIFNNLETREQEFIKNNIFTFESYFTKWPELAIRAFSFPQGIDLSENAKIWDKFILKNEQKFQSISSKHKEEFLENFYENILKITNSTPSNSMKYRPVMKRVVAQFFDNPEI